MNLIYMARQNTGFATTGTPARTSLRVPTPLHLAKVISIYEQALQRRIQIELETHKELTSDTFHRLATLKNWTLPSSPLPSLQETLTPPQPIASMNRVELRHFVYQTRDLKHHASDVLLNCFQRAVNLKDHHLAVELADHSTLLSDYPDILIDYVSSHLQSGYAHPAKLLRMLEARLKTPTPDLSDIEIILERVKLLRENIKNHKEKAEKSILSASNPFSFFRTPQGVELRNLTKLFETKC